MRVLFVIKIWRRLSSCVLLVYTKVRCFLLLRIDWHTLLCNTLSGIIKWIMLRTNEGRKLIGAISLADITNCLTEKESLILHEELYMEKKNNEETSKLRRYSVRFWALFVTDAFFIPWHADYLLCLLCSSCALLGIRWGLWVACKGQTCYL